MNCKILVLGAADLSDGIMFLKAGIEATNLIVTELRSESELNLEYGATFQENFDFLTSQGVLVLFGIDATKLYSTHKNLMENITFVFWGCPHFESGDFHTILVQTFIQVELCSNDLEQPSPTVGVALDCLGPDALYNLSSRFRAFHIEDWSVDYLIDMKDLYTFTATKGSSPSRADLSQIISDNILTLAYRRNPVCHGSKFDERGPYWCNLEEGDYTPEPMHYINLFKLPIFRMVDVLNKLDSPNELIPYYIGNGERKIWFNSLSVPNCKHPLRPTRILNILNSADTGALNSWAAFWQTAKGGAFMRRLSANIVDAITEHEENTAISQTSAI
ncbi:DUF2431 domain-containing protein [bacterium]|nr:DUF2431 domain-containing protein [bacterium]MDA9271887.1 DUF2431 domain-containing protein [bacterium]